MKPVRAIPLLTVAALVLSSFVVHADVRADEKSRVEFAGMLGRMVSLFGGKAAREGVTSTVAVKGDRKATLNDATGQIIDLNEEKIYDLDLKKKSYKVTTFAELRQQMEEARKKAEEEARKAPEAEKPAEPDPKQKEVEVDFDVKDTGEKKAINGFDTRQVVMTITVREKGKTLEEAGGIVMINDMWLGPEIPQMKEFSDFDIRYWKQLQGPQAAAMSAEQMAAVLAMFPLVGKAMERMQKDGDKLKGTPLDTTTTVESVKSKDQLTQAQSQSSGSSGGGIGGLLAKKIIKKEEPKARSTIFTTHHEVLEVSTSVSPADLAIPADFKEKK
jgi:hypothetical protein